MEGLAIIDDQATRSLISSSVIDELEIDDTDISSTNLTSTTIHGTTSQTCKNVKNLTITPLNNDQHINLDNALTQDLPDVLQDIPTPEEVLSIPGFSHLVTNFPTKRDWPTILLLGRDCMQAQILNQQISSKDKHQLAVETPLGWAIVGKPAKTTRPLQHQIEAYTEPTSSTTKNQSSTTADKIQIDQEDQQTSTLHTAIDSHSPTSEVIEENDNTGKNEES